jgi:hypothetical protein
MGRFAIVAAALCFTAAQAQEPAATAISAEELASRLNTALLGSAQIRTQLEVRNLAGSKRVLQLQIKQRRTKTATDLAYRVLWPNESKDQVVLLHQDAGRAPSGSIILPHQPARAIESSQMGDGLFDSDLSYQDAVENVYGWKEQATVGSEPINGVNCQILESRPGSSSVSIYAKVRSWIDPQRLVPLRIEKYSASGELIRRIDITRVIRDQRHQAIPSSLVVHGPRKNTVTEFNGARINQDVNFTDADFTPAGALR